MSRRQVEKITQRHGAKLETPALAVAPAPAVNLEDEQESLDSERKQQSIMHPDPKTVTLSFGALTLHKPSMQLQRRIYGFATRVISDAVAAPGASQGAVQLSVRIASMLCYREDLERDVLLLTARILGAPGKISDDRAERLADEMAEKASPDDIAALYAELCLLAGMQPPKNSKTRRQT